MLRGGFSITYTHEGPCAVQHTCKMNHFRNDAILLVDLASWILKMVTFDHTVYIQISKSHER